MQDNGTLTVEQIKNMSVEEINEVIQKEMEYNEYDYQKENNILIKKKKTYVLVLFRLNDKIINRKVRV